MITRIASVGLLLVGTSASAEYIQFSQYDGKKTWNNQRVEVADALSYKQQGSVYHRGTDRSAQAGTSPTDEIFWASGRVSYTFPSSSGTNTLYQVYYHASPASTFLDRKDTDLYFGTEVDLRTGKPLGAFLVSVGENVVVSDPAESEDDTSATSEIRTSGTKATPATEGIPSISKRSTETHLVVPVPTDAVMADFIHNFMNAQSED
jgi:hypothetical protein